MPYFSPGQRVRRISSVPFAGVKQGDVHVVAEGTEPSCLRLVGNASAFEPSGFELVDVVIPTFKIGDRVRRTMMLDGSTEPFKGMKIGDVGTITGTRLLSLSELHLSFYEFAGEHAASCFELVVSNEEEEEEDITPQVGDTYLIEVKIIDLDPLGGGILVKPTSHPPSAHPMTTRVGRNGLVSLVSKRQKPDWKKGDRITIGGEPPIWQIVTDAIKKPNGQFVWSIYDGTNTLISLTLKTANATTTAFGQAVTRVP